MGFNSGFKGLTVYCFLYVKQITGIIGSSVSLEGDVTKVKGGKTLCLLRIGM